MEAFGLYTQEIDGHDLDQIEQAIANAYNEKGRPSCIVLDTIKGKGVTFAEPIRAHSSQPSEEEWHAALVQAQKQLDDAKNQ